ncbi:MAG TPA: TlpA disulfide reductase family protein [Candidatus Eremiobacteraceae bacterium]|nr:TlpA disulfide reductase family protein [Candidatus Eremiobacteraceae bacterium]
MIAPLLLALSIAPPHSAHASTWSSGISSGSAPVAVAVGFRAPDFSLPTLDNRTVRLSDYRGNAVLLNFFASWCPACQDEMPIFVKTAPVLASSHIDFLGVDVSEEDSVVGDFAKHYSATTYPLALDRNGDEYRAYGFKAIPTTLVLDSDGIIAYRLTGGETDAKDLSDILRSVALRQEGDIVEGDAVIRTMRYDIASGSDRGALTVIVIDDSNGSLGVRVTEKWADLGTVASAVGSIAADGTIDFGSQRLPPLSRLVLPYFANELEQEAASKSTVSSVTGGFATSVRFALSTSKGGGRETISERMTAQDVSGSQGGYAASGIVLYSTSSKTPIAGKFAVSASGQSDTPGTYSFTLQSKPSR